ncbi:hypothetical protein Leryth_026011 [Lithospermum erythrorhizon]|nr:hypothetical protein Leryth_026011 [Lithospermum erythrorhizon]
MLVEKLARKVFYGIIVLSFSECPTGTYKNTTGSDKALCFSCPSHELPSRAAYIPVRGYTFGGPWFFGLLLLGLLILLALVLSVARMKFVGVDELPGPAPTSQGSQIDHSFPFLESLNEVLETNRVEESCTQAVLHGLPISLLFGGDGSYITPFSLHNDNIITSLMSQAVPPTTWYPTCGRAKCTVAIERYFFALSFLIHTLSLLAIRILLDVFSVLFILPLGILLPFPAGINALFSHGSRRSAGLARLYAVWNIISLINVESSECSSFCADRT